MQNTRGSIVILVILFMVVLILVGAGWWHFEDFFKTNLRSTPTATTIDYDELRHTVIEIPSEIPLYEGAIIEEKYVGFDKYGHKVYRANIRHDGLQLQEQYDFYISKFLDEGWEIIQDSKQFCSDSIYFCPEWIDIIAMKEDITLMIFNIGGLGFVQWYEGDISDIEFIIDSPLDPNVFPADFQPDLILVKTNIFEKEIHLEMYNPLTTTLGEHQELMVQNGYNRCAIGSVPMILGYNCSTDDESKMYFIRIIPADPYTFDIVDIRYTEK